MSPYQVGDRSVGICERCNVEVFAQMEYRDYSQTGHEVTIDDVLAGVCGRCNRLISLHNQSTYKTNCSTNDLIAKFFSEHQ